MSISLDGNLGVYTSGNVSATGNITADGFFVGNGAMLTGIAASANLSNVSGNIIPSANVTYSLGNSTNQWKDLWISNNTIYINSLPLSTVEVGNVTTIEFDGNPIVVSSNTAPPQTANISTTAAVVADEVVANSFVYANGTPFTGYTDADVSTYLASGNNTAGYSTTGNVTANLLIGDGSLITNLPAGNYSNINVAAYLASNTDTTITTIFLDIGNTNSNVANLTTTVANTNANVANLTTSIANTNANVANTNSNVANLTTSLANTNSNVANLTTGLANTNANVANNTSNITTLQGQVYGNANVAAYLPTYTGNITATNINVANTVTATTFIGNFQGNISGNLVVPGSNTWVLYNNNGNAGADIGFTYNAATQDVLVGNTVTANFFVGDGSQLTGLPAAYGNANVEAYLPTSNTIIAINANVANTDSNVANLTLTVANLATTSALANTDANVANLTTSLGNTNSNVANLVTITTNTDSNVANLTTALANTDSNVSNLTLTVANLATTSSLANTNANVANTDANVANLTLVTANNTSNIAQLTIAVAEGVTEVANTNANVANTNSNVANLQSQVNALPVINTIPSVYLTAVANGNGQSFTNVILGGYTSNTSMTAFLNGALLENTFYELAGDVLTVNTYLNTGDNIDVITTLASNVNNVTSGYGNSNVALFFNNYAGNIIPATNNAYQLGTVSDVWSAVYANSISSDALSVNGDVLIAGNANIQGNLTYTNITNLTTANLVLGLGNNQTGFNVTGAGIVAGNTNEASLLYNFSTQTWDSNLGISAVGNVTANNANFTGTVVADGNTNATAFAVVGNGATSNVALGFFPTGNTAAQMAIRDHSIVASSIYFDASAGGSANGVFNFRTSNAFTSYASLSNTGLTVNSTQTSNTNVNSTIYYNTSTSQLTAGPSMAAFANVSAPFTGNITTANMGHWFQAQGNIVLPQYTTVPVGTTFTITNSAGSLTGPLRVTVFNTGSDFIYYPPQFGNTTRYVELFFGQWMTLVSRGTGEWDIVASNISEVQKISAYTSNNITLALDLMNFRYDGTHTQFSPVSGSFTVAGQSIDTVPGQNSSSATFASGTYTAGTWYNLSGLASITTAGSVSQSFLYATNGTYNRSYRATFNIVSSGSVYITVERLVA